MDISFIVIDENELDCFIARKVIQHTDKQLNVVTFQDARHALEMINEQAAIGADGKGIVILLDLQMPLMDGFQFVEAFEEFPADVQQKYRIIILSSTLNVKDISRVLAYKSVQKMVSKPLTKDNFTSLLAELRLAV